MSSNRQINFYRVEGGALPLTDPTYVKRQADEQLYQFAQSDKVANRVCFVLAPRQTGKSSLMVRTAQRLTHEGFICVLINLQALGDVKSDRELWYNLLYIICREISTPDIKLVDRFNAIWNTPSSLQPTLQSKSFLIEEILPNIGDHKLIIFIDEIQTLVTWKLQDSFIGFTKALSETSNQELLGKLAFVLLGVAKPSDLVTSTSFALNLGQQIELGNLKGDCQPLWKGLEEVTHNPGSILDRILEWTGGQPFLTQVVCQLVASGHQIYDLSNLEKCVDSIVIDKVIKNWRRQDRLCHLQEIENWLARVEVNKENKKLKALNIYKQILSQGAINFNRNSAAQWELLISGLVAKEDGYLKVYNPIYQQVFTLDWVQEKEKALQESLMSDPLNRIYNRDVFILIDQSASMSSKNEGRGKTRWQLLEDLVTDHVSTILKEDDGSEAKVKICVQIYATTFNLNQRKSNFYLLLDSKDVKDIFRENHPGGNTYIVPTLRKCRDMWLNGREKVTAKDIEEGKAKGAFFIIYTDGQFDDTQGFEDFIKETCQKIDDERIVKILIVGIGKDINMEYFDRLDINRAYKDLKDQHCNIVVFDLYDSMDDIIELMWRQIGDTSHVREGFSLPNYPH